MIHIFCPIVVLSFAVFGSAAEFPKKYFNLEAIKALVATALNLALKMVDYEVASFQAGSLKAATPVPIVKSKV